ncbi:MAG: AAA family ATPase [Gammaproteobacteria bacterium]|nr:MAG: AAA family ATPase [Gammaproteobacteria bacterium]
MTSLPAIVLEGAKGVGKTESAKRRANTFYAMDEASQRAIANADITQILKGKNPILIDEWQRKPEVWDAVRRAVDNNNSPAQFLLTGSASPTKPPTHSGAGRIVSVRMRPLSLAERGLGVPTVSIKSLLQGDHCKIEGETPLKLADYVREMVTSGFPGIRHLSGRALRAQLDGYLARIVDRDFKDQGLNLRNPQGLIRWMTAYAAATATTASFETIRDAATGGEGQKPAKTTVQPYREILEQLWILDPVPAWLPSKNHITQLTQPPKHHLADPALAIRLLGLDESALITGTESGPVINRNGTLLGHLFESLVTQLIRVLAQAAEANIKHLRTKAGEHEVDLIIERPDQRIVAIEVKLSETIKDNDVKNLLWLKKQIGEDLLDAVVINTGKRAYRRPDGVAVVPAGLVGE